MTLEPGALVGPYRLGRLLGRGGMAVVYEATHESIGRIVALKLVAPDLSDPEFEERFRNEGRMQAALDHPHVVTVYEAGTSEYGPYLAMRLVHGTTLAGLIADGALSSTRTLDLLGQVAEALDAAHDSGLVHRDVKPRNVLVGEGDHAYLADFGLTRRSDAEGATATGHFMGTLAYVAPEIVAGELAGPATDRYALAAVLFECLTATTVFPRPTQAAVLYAHTNEPPPRVSGRRDGVPPALDDVLVAGLAKDPADRPVRAVDLIANARVALGDVELGPPVPRDLPAPEGATATGPVAQPRRSAPSGRRGRRALVLAGLLGLLAGGGAVALLDDDDRAPRPVARVTEAVPAPPDGTVSLGSDLATAGETRDCRGGPVRADSVACTLYQDHLPDATLVVPRNGVVSGWAVRSGTGELALTVLRRRDEGYFQVTRSRNEFVGNAEPHLFTTDLAVDRGDRVGVQVMPGAGVGLRPGAGTTTRRTIPQLSGAIQSPSSGPGGEILLRVYLRPGGRQHLPKGLVGAEAAAAPDGKVVERQRARFGNDVPFEARVVLLHGRGVLDLIRDGRRVSRIDIPDMQAPLGLALKLQLAVEPSLPERVGMYLEFSHLGSDRLLHHYFDATGRRITFVN